ncbi:universal stress protein [Ktedonospora formicarum]|uniref:Universal stress protein UspA n=1 Tax=Ktedonospora formicarum TaxID=2778364 RepID=A0A8J3IC99_9CHLR|nr:universal stress protein [Ktedonospora formicarum]GHO48744.1 universal stress protein UspA [Ktedonospora formicarum]
MFHHILVPLDGSERAEEALPLAAQLARSTGASLLLLRVIPSERVYISLYPSVPGYMAEQIRRSFLEGAQAYLEHIVAKTHLEDIPIMLDAKIGIPGEVIVHVAREQLIDLVVMRSHGYTRVARFFFGSVAQHVARHSIVPVLVIRDGASTVMLQAERQVPAPRLVVTLDGSSFAEEALVPATQLAVALASPQQGRVHLLCVIGQSILHDKEDAERHVQHDALARAKAAAYLASVEERFRTGDLATYALSVTSSFSTYRRANEIWQRIVDIGTSRKDECGQAGNDIFAMTTHGRTGLQRLHYGSITEHVLDAARSPLLVVHAHIPVASMHGAQDQSKSRGEVLQRAAVQWDRILLA